MWEISHTENKGRVIVIADMDSNGDDIETITISIRGCRREVVAAEVVAALNAALIRGDA